MGDGVKGMKHKETADELNLEWPDADKWTRERETEREDGIRDSSEGWNSQDIGTREVMQDGELGEFQNLRLRAKVEIAEALLKEIVKKVVKPVHAEIKKSLQNRHFVSWMKKEEGIKIWEGKFLEKPLNGKIRK